MKALSPINLKELQDLGLPTEDLVLEIQRISAYIYASEKDSDTQLRAIAALFVYISVLAAETDYEKIDEHISTILEKYVKEVKAVGCTRENS